MSAWQREALKGVLPYLQQDGVRSPGGEGGADGGSHQLWLELATLRGCQADQQAVGAGPHERDVQVGRIHILPRRQVLVPARYLWAQPAEALGLCAFKA